jgi:hypothetical protein
MERWDFAGFLQVLVRLESGFPVPLPTMHVSTPIPFLNIAPNVAFSYSYCGFPSSTTGQIIECG